MQRREKDRIASLHRIDSFLKKHANKLTPVNGGGALKTLSDHISLVTEYADAQRITTVASRHATGRKRAARRVLEVEHMRPITHIAAMILPAHHSLARVGKSPHSLSTEAVRIAALKMARAARPHAAAIVAVGRPHDFIERLAASAEALGAAVNVQKQWAAASRVATASLRRESLRTRKIVRVLDALVRECIQMPTLLREWDVARRATTKARVGPMRGHDARPHTAAAPLMIVEQDLTA